MTPRLTTALDEEALARVDALARPHAVTREEMLARIVDTGLLHEERQALEMRARRDGAPS